MLGKRMMAVGLGALLAAGTASPVLAQISVVSDTDSVRAGELQVPVNKSQVLRVDRAYGKAPQSVEVTGADGEALIPTAISISQ